MDTDMFWWEEEIQGTFLPMFHVLAADISFKIFSSHDASKYTQFERKTQN